MNTVGDWQARLQKEIDDDGIVHHSEFEIDWDDSWDDESDLCHYCNGDGWGIVGLDWDCEDGVNGPYNGEADVCPCCHGSGKEKDATFW